MPLIDPQEGFELWAASYDQGENALRLLAERALREAVGDRPKGRILDAGCGTGSWLREHPTAVGLDLSPAMLRQCPPGRAALANLEAPPVRVESVDLVVACLVLSYLSEPAAGLDQLMRALRPDGRLVVVDLHPEAHRAGWRRTFRDGDETYEIASRPDRLDAAIRTLANPDRTIERVEAVAFGARDQPWFDRSGAPSFAAIQGRPALQLAVLRKARSGSNFG